MIFAVIEQRVIQKSTVIISIKTQQPKWQSRLHSLDGFYDQRLLSDRQGDALRPS